MEDKELIMRCLNGDETAFRSLIQRYLKQIYAFVYHYVNDTYYSEDITQEVFIKAWKTLRRFNTQKSFKTWLYVIAKNTALDFLKKKKAISFSSLEVDDKIYEKHDNSQHPLDILKFESDIELLQKALKQLPFNYQQILILYYRAELNLREIAEVLGIPSNTVKSNYRRALKMLKQKLIDLN